MSAEVSSTIPAVSDSLYIEALAAPDTIADELQREGSAAFAKSWSNLMSRIASKSEALAKARQG